MITKVVGSRYIPTVKSTTVALRLKFTNGRNVFAGSGKGKVDRCAEEGKSGFDSNCT